MIIYLLLDLFLLFIYYFFNDFRYIKKLNFENIILLFNYQ